MPDITAADAIFMHRALELAAQGVALASPNPMVGAVLVRKEKIIGEGLCKSRPVLPQGTHRPVHERADSGRRETRRGSHAGPQSCRCRPRLQASPRRRD